MKPLTPEQIAAAQKRLAEIAARHGLETQGWNVIIPGADGSPIAEVDMGAMDYENRFMVALMHNLRKIWVKQGMEQARDEFGRTTESVPRSRKWPRSEEFELDALLYKKCDIPPETTP